jgi:hypothetical protein
MQDRHWRVTKPSALRSGYFSWLWDSLSWWLFSKASALRASKLVRSVSEKSFSSAAMQLMAIANPLVVAWLWSKIALSFALGSKSFLIGLFGILFTKEALQIQIPTESQEWITVVSQMLGISVTFVSICISLYLVLIGLSYWMTYKVQETFLLSLTSKQGKWQLSAEEKSWVHSPYGALSVFAIIGLMTTCTYSWHIFVDGTNLKHCAEAKDAAREGRALTPSQKWVAEMPHYSCSVDGVRKKSS